MASPDPMQLFRLLFSSSRGANFSKARFLTVELPDMGFAAPPHDFYSFLWSHVAIANSDSCLKLLAGLSLDVSMKSSVQTPKSFQASIMARKVSLLSFLLAGAGCC